jgi:transcriptional regulator with XRE-family HTH domain
VWAVAGIELRPTLRLLRLSRGKTLGAVAAEVGVSRRTLMRWEKGKTRPHVDYARRLAEAYGVSVDDIASLVRAEGCAG